MSLERRQMTNDTSRGISVLLIKNSKVYTKKKYKNLPFFTRETI
jgi:hypothetical protein